MNRQAEIERIAFLLWCDEGWPEGRELDHYFAAEQAWEDQFASQKAACEKLDAAEPRPSRKTRGQLNEPQGSGVKAGTTEKN